MNGQKYQQEQDKINISKTREILATLPPFIKDFINGIADYTSTRTRLAYAYDIRVFFLFIQENNPLYKDKDLKEIPISVLDELTRKDIEEYLDYMTYYQKEGKEVTNHERGKARKISSLRSMYRYYYQHEMIKNDTAALVPVPKLHENVIIRLEPNEVAILLDQVESGAKLTASQLKYHQKTKLRDVAILTLLLGTGIRVSECVGIDINDVDFDNDGVMVHRKGGYDSIVYFGYEVETALQDYLEERRNIIAVQGSENALFLSLQNKRMSVRAVEKMVKKYAENVTTLKKITPHKLRSTYGTTLYRESGDIYLVASVLGHSDVNTTRKHYAALDEDRKRSAVKYVQLRDKENKPEE
ncbi:MAG: tyrosine-type recombinase/integrase [Lachnospiraceae bacterium]|nr:tyrosine-type recombinase/integrase [Lachnospiraceae bacterium]